jgi:S-(hydroxymethyl)mycothiol dehydrogenase
MARGVILSDPGVAPALEEFIAGPPAEHEVLVRIAASGVCHTDLHVRDRGGWGMEYPILLGHEGAGVIEALGDGVEHLSIGDRVVLTWAASCGKCRTCLRGAPRLCGENSPASRTMRRAADGRVLTPVLDCGAFATHTVVHESAVVVLHEDIPLDRACLIGCAVSTGVGAALNTANVWPGSTAVIIGCGAIGLSTLQGARIAGAARIVAVDLVPVKLEWAAEFGATDLINASNQDPVEAVWALTDGEGADFAFEAVGAPQLVSQIVAMLGHAGTAVTIGVPPPGAVASVDLVAIADRRLTLVNSWGGDPLPENDFARLVSLYRSGELKLDEMVTRRIGLDEVAEAFRAMEAGEVIRSVIVME